MNRLPDSQPIADLATDGPLTYDRFLALASDIAKQLQAAHECGLVFGHLALHSVFVGPEDEIVMPESAPAPPEDSNGAIQEDLSQVGHIFAYLLTGGQTEGSELAEAPIHPVLSETMPLDTWSLLLPPEAKLLIEQLLSKEPDRISSARELAVTLQEMKRLHKLPTELASDARGISARTYGIIAVIVLVLIIAVIIAAIIYRP